MSLLDSIGQYIIHKNNDLIYWLPNEQATPRLKKMQKDTASQHYMIQTIQFTLLLNIFYTAVKFNA